MHVSNVVHVIVGKFENMLNLAKTWSFDDKVERKGRV